MVGKELERLLKWLQLPGNSKAAVAAHCGLESTNAISQWITRGEIPRRHIMRIREFLSK